IRPAPLLLVESGHQKRSIELHQVRLAARPLEDRRRDLLGHSVVRKLGDGLAEESEGGLSLQKSDADLPGVDEVIVPESVQLLEGRRPCHQNPDSLPVLDGRPDESQKLKQFLQGAGEEAFQTLKLVDTEENPQTAGKIVKRFKPPASHLERRPVRQWRKIQLPIASRLLPRSAS